MSVIKKFLDKNKTVLSKNDRKEALDVAAQELNLAHKLLSGQLTSPFHVTANTQKAIIERKLKIHQKLLPKNYELHPKLIEIVKKHLTEFMSEAKPSSAMALENLSYSLMYSAMHKLNKIKAMDRNDEEFNNKMSNLDLKDLKMYLDINKEYIDKGIITKKQFDSLGKILLEASKYRPKPKKKFLKEFKISKLKESLIPKLEGKK